ncbi:MAG: choice-of-anchor D domain-containing protein [Alphaproteobacteria bacterium]|nr:choice-of-anchor D domain-containing protein [Alphaproteobacteria bacterium]
MRLTPALLLVFGLGAECSDQNINPIKPDDDVELIPEIEITPELIDFGDARQGETFTQWFTITNVGTDVLDVSAIRLESGTSFTMVDEVELTLQPGDEHTVQVSFSPQTLEHEGRVVVESNDPAASRSVVELHGYGLIPRLQVWPDPYDYGIVEPDCVRDGYITLQNVGRETLVIDGIAQLGNGFTLDESELALPLDLAPQDAIDVRVDFAPTEIAAFEGELWVTSNGGDEIVQQTGEGGPAAQYDDEWKQPLSNVADIFFYVDQSCSMEDDQERLANNFDQFTAALADLDADYQIFVATSDGGCTNLNPPITQDTDPGEVNARFRQAVAGPSGIYTEAGLMIVRNALHPDRLAGCNSALLRENATTSFVLISDEPEQSPQPGGAWSTSVAAIQAIVPSSYISAVVGPLPDGCETAEPGAGYVEAATATGGLVRSLCDTDWGTHLSELAALATRVKLADTFYLDQQPQAETLEVFVEGEPVTEGWTYHEENNTIVFDEDAVPGEGETIHAVYQTGFTCD